jgi:hypothetical protein
MQCLVFTCPHSGQTIDSGISTNADSLLAVRELEIEMKCPHCATRHRFPIRGGYFAPPVWDSGLSQESWERL